MLQMDAVYQAVPSLRPIPSEYVITSDACQAKQAERVSFIILQPRCVLHYLPVLPFASRVLFSMSKGSERIMELLPHHVRFSQREQSVSLLLCSFLRMDEFNTGIFCWQMSVLIHFTTQGGL